MRKDYQCPTCSTVVEVIQSLKDEVVVPVCPTCGSEMDWLPTKMSFELKGGGWPSKAFKRFK